MRQVLPSQWLMMQRRVLYKGTVVRGKKKVAPRRGNWCNSLNPGVVSGRKWRLNMATEKKARVVQCTLDAGKVVFTVAGQVALVVNPSAMSEKNREYAMLHGIKQRVMDAAALERDTATGLSATPEQKYEAMKAIVDHLNSGAEEWNIRGQGRGPRVDAEFNMLLTAIAEVRGMETEALREWLKKKTPSERLALSMHASIKPTLDAIRELSAGAIDEERLFEGL